MDTVLAVALLVYWPMTLMPLFVAVTLPIPLKPKALAGWVQDTVPGMAHGNYEALKNWIGLSNEERRIILEQARLIYTKEEEVMLVLAGEPAHEPILY